MVMVAQQWESTLYFMPLRLCSCCSLQQECHCLPLVLWKFPFFCRVLVSFPQGVSHSPLLPSHFTGDPEVAHLPAVTRSHARAFVLAVLTAEVDVPEWGWGSSALRVGGAHMARRLLRRPPKPLPQVLNPAQGQTPRGDHQDCEPRFENKTHRALT